VVAVIRVIETVFLPLNAISCLSKPAEVITSVALGLLTFKEKLPLLSVDVPVLVPFTRTDAAGTGSPEVAVTLPVTTFPCAND